MTAERDEAAQALKKAVDLLSRRAFGSRELAGRLVEKGFSQQAADGAVCRLLELDLLDDRAYAEGVRDSLNRRGYGDYRIRRELEQRGIDADLISSLLDGRPPDEDAMAQYIDGRLKGKNPDRAQAQKVVQGLVRRGFSWGDAQGALNAYLREETAETREDDLWQ